MSFDKLFAKWKTEYSFDSFIRDGIVDPTCYESPHILFILRDMNCRQERDLCGDLRRDGSGWKTWNNIGRWTKALLDGAAEYPRDMSAEKRAAQLKRIAVMNLKKEGGGGRTDGTLLLEAVRQQRDPILDEIHLCDPDLIVCCGLSMKHCPGNADLLWQYVFPDCSDRKNLPSENLPHTWQFYYAAINGKQVPVISFCHPQATNLCGCRGHEKLFAPLYRDMLHIRKVFLETSSGGKSTSDDF